MCLKTACHILQQATIMFITKIEIFSKTIDSIIVSMHDTNNIRVKGTWDASKEYYMMEFYCTVPHKHSVDVYWKEYGILKDGYIYMDIDNSCYKSHCKFELESGRMQHIDFLYARLMLVFLHDFHRDNFANGFGDYVFADEYLIIKICAYSQRFSIYYTQMQSSDFFLINQMRIMPIRLYAIFL